MVLNIATAIDSLVELIKEKKKLTLEQASQELGLPENIINEWSNFLEEEGIIKITYKFTTPYLELKEKVKDSNEEEDLKRRVDLATRKLDLILSKLKKYKIAHKYEINNIDDVRTLLKNKPKVVNNDVVYAQKFTLEYKIKGLLETIDKIKLITPDLIKFIEKKIEDIEEKKALFEKNYNKLS